MRYEYKPDVRHSPFQHCVATRSTTSKEPTCCILPFLIDRSSVPAPLPYGIAQWALRPHGRISAEAVGQPGFSRLPSLEYREFGQDIRTQPRSSSGLIPTMHWRHKTHVMVVKLCEISHGRHLSTHLQNSASSSPTVVQLGLH